ncbi:MAG: transglutaminase domain-containing protein [Acidobacteriota bacterium]
MTRALLHDVRIEVRPDGELHERRRIAIQIQRKILEGIAYRGFGYGQNMKIKSSRAWHLPPGERAKKSSRAHAFDIKIGDSFLSDKMTRLVAVEDVRRGSLVFFEFKTSRQPYTLSFAEYFIEEGPILLSRFELETPPGWSVQSAWLRHSGPEPQLSGSMRIWELHDLPALVEEPLGESPFNRAPILMINLVPPPGVSVKPAIVQNWEAVSLWYEDLARERVKVTSEIARKGQDILAPVGDGMWERLRAGAHFVRDNVRYIAKEIGIGGYQPQAASDVLRARYGDCKDKSTLYQALLSSAGILSYPVLVSVGEPETVDPRVPSIQSFNHMIVAVPVPPGTVVPGSVASAVTSAGDLGRLLFVDTTDEHSSFGAVPAGLAGSYGLVVAGERSRLVRLPGFEPDAHRIVRRLHAELGRDQKLRGKIVSEFWGAPASEIRASYRQSVSDRRAAAEWELRSWWNEARLLDYSAEPETEDGRYIETITLEAGPLAGYGLSAWVPLFPGADEGLPRVSLGKRRTAVVYHYPRVLRFETRLHGLPESIKIPSPHRFQSEYGSIWTAFERHENTIEAVWEMRLERTRFEPEAFDELRRLWSEAAAAARPIMDVLN